MSAVVVAFEAFKPNPQRPWQNHELAELYRAVDILQKAGLAIETDMGMSDEGEPWFAFCRADNGEVIVHCARINGLFVANSIAIDQTFRGTNFREVIDSIVRYEPLKIPLSTAGARLTLHPIMVLAAFVATAFLFAHKADAHDLHAAIVTLNGGHDSAGAPKGFAAVKAAVGGLLQSLAVGSSDIKTMGQSAQTTDVEAPAALAALMAAAMSLISTTAQTYGINDLLPAPAAAAAPVDTSVSSLAVADPASTLLAPIDRSAPIAPIVDDSAYQAWVGALIAVSSPTLQSKPIITAALVVAHDAPSVDLSALPAPDFAHAAAAAGTAEHFAFPLQHVVETAVTAPSAEVATTAATTQTTSSTPAPIFDMSEVSPVAMAILLGQGTLPANESAIQILQGEYGSGGSPPNGGSGNPPAGGLPPGGVPPNGGAQAAGPTSGSTVNSGTAPPASHSDTTSTITSSNDSSEQPQPNNPSPPAANGGNQIVIEEPQAPANASNPADQAPQFIWLTGNPNAGMAQLMNYAESYHPLLDRPLISPAADLIAALNLYNSNGTHPNLVVFDSNAINLNFFEFSQGVLMVSDHELGYTPSANALAMATIVELASGAQMRILGVLDVVHNNGF